ncbi:response regulator [Candidatus Roizmanbacteria bacterium]|nr:response regulator [Candidatus Roizmanbacteria bacterium]
MKVLIADDDVFFRNFYSTKLKENGFIVETASDGDEALEKIKVSKPDLILLDIIMPNKDGFLVLNDLRADQQLSMIPVIVFSTLGQEQDMEKAKTLGAKDYINKSYFDFPKMLEKIKEIMKK